MRIIHSVTPQYLTRLIYVQTRRLPSTLQFSAINTVTASPPWQRRTYTTGDDASSSPITPTLEPSPSPSATQTTNTTSSSTSVPVPVSVSPSPSPPKRERNHPKNHSNNLLPPRPTLPTSDLKHTYLKGSGPGGQKINKTSSAVQLTHLPTGIVVKSQATRSRRQNHDIARRILAEKVEVLQKGAESRVEKKRELIGKRTGSADKKKRRKYRRLEEEKKKTKVKREDGEEEEEEED